MGLIRKVAIDLIPLLPHGANGGAKIFVLDLIKNLAEVASNCEFLLLTRDATYAELADLERVNVRRILIPTEQRGNLGSSWRSIGRMFVRHLPPRIKVPIVEARARVSTQGPKRLVDELDHELLFCPFTTPTLHISDIPTICIVYDLQHKEYPQFFTREERTRRDTALYNAARHASALAAISEYSRQSVLKHVEIDRDRVVTIPLRMAQRVRIVDRQTCEAAISPLGLNYERYFLYPANFWPHKNHEALLQSFLIARNNGLAPDVKLVLTGNPDHRQHTIKELAQRLTLSASVVIPGFVDEGQFEAVLSGCAAVIFPSLFEGFGLPIIEAMAVGRPVACSRVTSLPEVADDAALMFDPRTPSAIASAMTRLMSDQRLRARLIASGLERARAFANPMQTAKEYWGLFERATSANAGVARNPA